MADTPKTIEERAIDAEENMTYARWGFGAATVAVMSVLLAMTYCTGRPSDARVCMDKGGSWMPVLVGRDRMNNMPIFEQSCVLKRDRDLVPQPAPVPTS